MQIQLKSEMPFIRQKGITSGYVQYKNGVYVLTSDKFKQNLKKKEYDALMSNRVGAEAEEGQDAGASGVQSPVGRAEREEALKQMPKSQLVDYLSSKVGAAVDPKAKKEALIVMILEAEFGTSK